jgi:hypothetical protein
MFIPFILQSVDRLGDLKFPRLQIELFESGAELVPGGRISPLLRQLGPFETTSTNNESAD